MHNFGLLQSFLNAYREKLQISQPAADEDMANVLTLQQLKEFKEKRKEGIHIDFELFNNIRLLEETKSRKKSGVAGQS